MRADEKLTAFVELQRTIHEFAVALVSANNSLDLSFTFMRLARQTGHWWHGGNQFGQQSLSYMLLWMLGLKMGATC